MDFEDSLPPQSYQPFAVADAVLQLGLTTLDGLRIDCIDINPRVVDHLRDPPLVLRVWPRYGTAEFAQYLEHFGRAIGTASNGTIRLSEKLLRRIHSAQANIVTERTQAHYDLAIATNVLLYFANPELMLGLANLQAALAPGGWLVHNEGRPEVDAFSRALDFEPQHARRIHIAGQGNAALYDFFVLHRKK
jgi:chemotaxis methyl-accepting protein methylase